MEKFYITTAIPYVNAHPHVGHALEFVQADTIARYQKLLGKEVLLLSGGDENALKNVQAAEKAGKGIQEFIDENSLHFEKLAHVLNVELDVFQKGSNKSHHMSSQKLWDLCYKNGDIYKKTYTGLYCVGCEAFYEPEDLNEKGECFEHPGKPLEEISEENYFFKLSKYQNQILELLENETIKIIPESRKNEAVAFVKQGLRDISISRSNERAKNWGVAIPGDNSQRMYVWFDALNIYQSGIGFGSNNTQYQKWWPADTHVIGKGILKFHAIYWPAFLLSAGLSLPKELFVHGYFTVDGQKMSKSLGNVIDPFSLVEKYGADTLRYYFLSQIPSTDDGDFSEEKLKHIYNSDLANGIGNLVARVAKLCEKSNYKTPEAALKDIHISNNFRIFMEKYDFLSSINYINSTLRECDARINKEEPWKINGQSELHAVLDRYVLTILTAAYHLKPILPHTSDIIIGQFSGSVKSSTPLFPRLQ